MNKRIKTIVNSIKRGIKKDILIRYHNAKYWDTQRIIDRMNEEELSRKERFEVIKEIYGYDETVTVFDLPRRIQLHFDLNPYYETEKVYKCRCCGKKAKVYRIFDVDGMNLEESLVCLNCGDGTLGYKNLKC